MQYLETVDDKGRTKKLTIEELEKDLAAQEWIKEQEYYLRHPEMRKNNFFMK